MGRKVAAPVAAGCPDATSSPARSRMSLSSLPEEVQLRVMQAALGEDRHAWPPTDFDEGIDWMRDVGRWKREDLPLVCKAWSRISRSEELWGTLVISFGHELAAAADVEIGNQPQPYSEDHANDDEDITIDAQAVLSTLSRHGHALRRLSIQSWGSSGGEGSDGWANTDFEASILKDMLACCPNLERFHVRWGRVNLYPEEALNASCLFGALAMVPRLVALHLQELPITLTPADAGIIPDMFPLLEDLEIEPSDDTDDVCGIVGHVPSAWGRLKHLRRLSLVQHYGMIAVEGFQEGFFRGATALEELFLNVSMNFVRMPRDFYMASSLRILEMDVTNMVEFPSDIWSLKNLQRVMITGITRQTLVGLSEPPNPQKSLMCELPRLLELRLSAGQDIDMHPTLELDLGLFVAPKDLRGGLRVLHLTSFLLGGNPAVFTSSTGCLARSALVDLRYCAVDTPLLMSLIRDRAPLMSQIREWEANANEMLPLVAYHQPPKMGLKEPFELDSVLCCCSFAFDARDMERPSTEMFPAAPFCSHVIPKKFRSAATRCQALGTLWMGCIRRLKELFDRQEGSASGPEEQQQEEEEEEKKWELKSATIALLIHGVLSGIPPPGNLSPDAEILSS